MPLNRVLAILAGIGLLFGPLAVGVGRAETPLAGSGFPGAIRNGLDHLLQVAAPRENRVVQGEQIAALLDFVATGDPLPPAAEGTLAAASAYCRFDVHRRLADVVRLGYSPDIPSHILMPSSVRLARWTEVEGQPGRQLPKLWPLVGQLDRPLIVKGIERVENTPDLHSGAYYAYDLDRTLILLQHDRRPYLISISIQKETSDVGRKGQVLGADSDWNYLYFDEAGLDRPGLGWVRSYMYAGWTVCVYADIGDNRPLVRCGIFRWLRAGWASINMVRTGHIEEGLKRYAETFRKIIEDPNLPDADTLSAGFARIGRLTDGGLVERTRRYFNALVDTYGIRLTASARQRLHQLGAGGPAASMDRSRMEALLAVQYLKAILGKHTGSEISDLNAPAGTGAG